MRRSARGAPRAFKDVEIIVTGSGRPVAPSGRPVNDELNLGIGSDRVRSASTSGVGIGRHMCGTSARVPGPGYVRRMAPLDGYRDRVADWVLRDGMA